MQTCPLEHKLMYRDKYSAITCDYCSKEKYDCHSWIDEGCSMVVCLDCKLKCIIFE